MDNLSGYSQEDLNNLNIIEPHLGNNFTQLIDGEDKSRETMEEELESEAMDYFFLNDIEN